MERLKKGEKYWAVSIDSCGVQFDYRIEQNNFTDDSYWKTNNYFKHIYSSRITILLS